ncbi:lytic transglycosylase domain-containing protein [Fibrobacter sp. UBA3718]|uniref:lytic transglycosylase domain-containing protein n=1 Tax=Fibrobacter sp. UBA3718 TaxID=1946531 RepID=UPI0025BA4B62|nr:lytic transglycosylase domain-containing protein [Fibrobacter sp. UBA3718]
MVDLCRSAFFRRFIPVLGLIVACNASGENGDKAAQDSVADSASVAPAAPAVPVNPYAELEQVEPDKFQNFIVHADLAKAAFSDTTLSADVRDFAKAAYYYYTEKWDSAFVAYEALRTRDPKLESAVVLRMAKSRFMQGDFAGMREVLKQGAKFEKDNLFAKTAADLRIDAALDDSTLSEAARADSLKHYLDRNTKGEKVAALRFRYAVYLEKIKQQKQAKRYYMQVLAMSSPYKDSAFTAIQRLRKVRTTPESLAEKVAYARMACGKEEASACLDLLDSIRVMDERAVAKHPESALEPSGDSLQMLLPKSTLDLNARIALWEKRVVALKALKREQEAIAQYVYLIDSVEARPVWIQAALRMMRNAATKNTKEIRRLDAILQDVSQFSKENANNLWVRGFEHEQQARYDSAIVCFKKLSNSRFGNNQKRQWAKFRIGLIYFKQEKWNEAEKAFVDAAKDPFLWSGSGSRMFLADTYMKMGKDSLAREAYLDCIRDFPLGYYAHRSRIKLVEYKLMEASEVPYAHGIPMSLDSTLAWVRSVQKNDKKDASYSPENYGRIKNLFQYGFSEEAFTLYEELRKKNAKRLDFLYEFGKLFYEMGETAAGYRLARQFQAQIDRRKLMEPPLDVLHYLFPVPYKDQVKFHSGTRIDPFFVYSVMRQESIFNFQIVSPAGACGLLQIMPATGRMLAKQEGLANFDPSQLYNAYLNIRLGIRYLVDLKAEYKDDYMYVLGNYNAGPKPTRRWQAAGAGLPWDIRAEDISYWETRDYVKRVMGNYWIYQEIYDEI